MTSSALFGDVMLQDRILWTIGEHLYFVYYPVISYQRITFYKVETMNIGRSHWNNGVSVTVIISIVVITMVLIVRDKILW